MPRYGTCLNCNDITVSNHLNRDKKFCSNKCKYEYRTKQNKKTKLCKYCGQSFSPGKSSQEFCSQECYNEARRIHDPNFICQHCGKSFATSKNAYRKPEYCSQDCWVASTRKAIKCLNCDKEFTVGKSKDRKFCSQACSNRYYQSPDPSKWTITTCKGCGQQFNSRKYHQSVFCSYHCMSVYAARQPRPKTRRPENFVTIKCEICEKEYTVHKAQKELRNSRFCSHKCLNVFLSVKMKGNRNPNYVDGSSPQDYGENWWKQSRKARTRDKNTCQNCGLLHDWENGNIIDVDHKIPFRIFNDYKKANQLSNLVCLCRKCHRKEEEKFRKLELR